MMRKLRDLSGANGYTATGLALVSWSAEDAAVRIEMDRVPEDVRPEQFMTKMIEQILAATSVSHHVDVRSKFERREIPAQRKTQLRTLSPDTAHSRASVCRGDRQARYSAALQHSRDYQPRARLGASRMNSPVKPVSGLASLLNSHIGPAEFRASCA